MGVLCCVDWLVCNKVTGLLLLAMVGFKLYLWYIMGVCKSKRRMDGKTVIITGANSGIGKETARDLAGRGARVIMACLHMQLGNAARRDIVKSTGNTNIEVRFLDLSSLSSVRKFAKEFLDSEDHLNVLVNNAGIAGVRNKKTADGLDICMQINHFGPFLLTCLLSDILKKSAPSRIIMVSSCMHTRGNIELHNLQCDRPVWHLQVYQNSKLCNALMAMEFSRRLASTGVTANSLHPGAVWTQVFRQANKLEYTIFFVLGKLFFKNPVQGAQTTIHLAVAEEMEGVSGKYFENCREKTPSPLALDAQLAQKLWERSEEAVGLQQEEKVRHGI